MIKICMRRKMKRGGGVIRSKIDYEMVQVLLTWQFFCIWQHWTFARSRCRIFSQILLIWFACNIDNKRFSFTFNKSTNFSSNWDRWAAGSGCEQTWTKCMLIFFWQASGYKSCDAEQNLLRARNWIKIESKYQTFVVKHGWEHAYSGVLHSFANFIL